MLTKLYNQSGEPMGDIELSDQIFARPFKADLVSQVVNGLAANARQVIAHTKGRGEVRGGGKKPWRQKGTGRARHASIRSPIWKGGGVTFGPTKERNFKKKINKKMKRLALFMVLSAKVRDNEFLVLDNFQLAQPKTKVALGQLQTLSKNLIGYRWSKGRGDSVLVVTPDGAAGVKRAVRNLPFAAVVAAKNLNIREILANKYLILLQESVSVIEQTFNK